MLLIKYWNYLNDHRIFRRQYWSCKLFLSLALAVHGLQVSHIASFMELVKHFFKLVQKTKSLWILLTAASDILSITIVAR